MSENIGVFTQSLPIQAALVRCVIRVEVVVCHRAHKCVCFLVHCTQVSIAGQPGGVEAARMKIRVSLNSGDLNLTLRDGQAKNPNSPRAC